MADEPSDLPVTNSPDELAALFGRTTISKDAANRFRQKRPRIRAVAVLTPIAGLAPEKIRIEKNEICIGRDKSQDAVIPDSSVSRKHARIMRVGDEYVLEDLGSSNGTHVDDVPVVTCVLHDGDTVQFGQNLYYFERVLEPVFGARGEAQ